MKPSRSLTHAIVIAVVTAALVLLVIVAAGWTPRVEYVLALAVGAAACTVALRGLRADVAQPSWPPAVLPRAEPGGVDPRIATIETSLRRGAEDQGVCRRRVQPLLFDLATHRLRYRRGIELIEEPEAAAVLLGDEPFRFLTEVVVGPAAPATLQRTVTAIEQL